ncbi:uncharacterized protein TNIN_195891 [Trichonephila inaurata madagascariensis]|uniref:Reverse transcriptase n=1 Tax=Trichonephila inaurata madagascariensis TaxID=2747483 RepID=A0A8X7CJ99_9ARAC|nr:uncharacterized protein TNIN_195891 [Trichonephila inaurata madagascariensis]
MEWTFEIKYLGLILNDNLTYKPHFDETTKKFYALKDLIGRKSKLSLKNRLFVYKQYLCSSLLYGCSIWGSTDELHTDTDISSNYLDYSSDDSCSELSSDEDLSSARIFTEVDVKNPPVLCPRFKFSGIPSEH